MISIRLPIKTFGFIDILLTSRVEWLSGSPSTCINYSSTLSAIKSRAQISPITGALKDYFVRLLPIDLADITRYSTWDKSYCIARWVMGARKRPHHVKMQSQYLMRVVISSLNYMYSFDSIKAATLSFTAFLIEPITQPPLCLTPSYRLNTCCGKD